MPPQQSYYQIAEVREHLHRLQLEHWLQYEVFTLQWWALLAVFIIPWIVWWKLVDKTRISKTLNYGLVIMFFVIAMDSFGIALRRWIYPVQLVPLISHTIGIDWSLLPVAHMLIYQYFSPWKQFLVVETAGAALLAFAGEPLAEVIGIYMPLNWYHHWSFPLYVTKAIIARMIVEAVIGNQENSNP